MYKIIIFITFLISLSATDVTAEGLKMMVLACIILGKRKHILQPVNNIFGIFSFGVRPAIEPERRVLRRPRESPRVKGR